MTNQNKITGWIGLAVLALAACSTAPAAEPARSRPPVAVRLAKVAVEAVAKPVRATGFVGWDDQVKLAPKIGGVVAAIDVEVGDHVKRGQPLARLVTTEIDAKVAQAIQGAEKAERDLARVKALHEGRAATTALLDDAGTASRVAEAGLAEARFNRAYAGVRAPDDGIVLARLAEPGEVVGPGQPLVVIGAGGDQVVRVGLADKDFLRTNVGDPGTIGLPDGSTRAVTVLRRAAAATQGVGTFEVVLRITPQPGQPALPAGLVASVEVRPPASAPVKLVPLAALVDVDEGRAAVWSPGAEGTVVRVPVEVAFLDHDRVAVTGALGAEVVAEGAAYLDERSTIRVATASAEVRP